MNGPSVSALLAEARDKFTDSGEVKKIGYSCAYVPFELLSVKGLSASRLVPSRRGWSEYTDVYLSNVTCSFCRNIFEPMVAGERPEISGYVFSASCDHLRRVYDNAARLMDGTFFHMLDLPHKSHERAVKWYARELRALGRRLADELGAGAEPGDLRRAIGLANKLRRQLKRLETLRFDETPRLSGADYLRLALFALENPLKQVVPALEGLMPALLARAPLPESRARVVLAGSALEDPEYVAVIERAGALVAAELGCFSRLVFELEVDEGRASYEALAERYLRRTPCPRMMGTLGARIEEVQRLVRQTGAHGVIVQTMKFCDIWGVEGNLLVKKLTESGLAVLKLERECGRGGEGQLTTRVQAFIESLGR